MNGPELSTGLVVLGAGPAGLGLAHRAAGAGHEVLVVERERRVGGAAGSFEVAGIRVDHGSHRLHPSIDPAILAELRDLLGTDLQRRARRGRIRLAGRWLPFPLTPAATAMNLPPAFGLRAAMEAITSRGRAPQADTFADVVRSGLGPTMATRFYEPYARKLWGVDADRISGEQARRRIRAATPGALLRRVLDGRHPEKRTFLYPRRGFGQTWEALERSATARGARIELGCTTVALTTEDGNPVVVVLDDGRRIRARHVFSTVPLPVLVRLLGDRAPAFVRASASQLRTRAMTLVYLVLDRPQYTPFDAHYLPEDWTPVTRVSEPKNYRDGRPGPDDPGDPTDRPGPDDPGDPTDRTVLCAEIPCDRGDDIWRADHGHLQGVVTAALRRSDLPVPDVVAVEVRRMPSVYPIYDLGYERHLAAVDDWIGAQPGITTFGRQGLFVHDNSHHALAMAWAAADALRPDATMDATAWGRARAGFAHHVVED